MTDDIESVPFEERSFSVRTTALILEISQSKVFEMLADGDLGSFTVGRSRRITGRSINAFRCR